METIASEVIASLDYYQSVQDKAIELDCKLEFLADEGVFVLSHEKYDDNWNKYTKIAGKGNITAMDIYLMGIMYGRENFSIGPAMG